MYLPFSFRRIFVVVVLFVGRRIKKQAFVQFIYKPSVREV